jgi:hypothetical protein
MKTTITTMLAFALLVSPLFGGNDTNYTYLALGDSVAFGFNPLLLPPYATQLPTPDKFIGYPEVVAALENLLQSKKEVNAACPGETSGSFLDINTPDNGCNSSHFQPPDLTLPPFKTSIGLHTPYTIAQMDFAVAQFKANKHINLVTLGIGANDVLLLLAQCRGDLACVSPLLDGVLHTYKVNLHAILMRIRAQYQGTLILVKYYAPSPALDAIAVELNSAMTQAAVGFQGIKFADGYTVFRLASAPFNHDACQAGLVIKLPLSPPSPTPCDIHPTPLGRDLLGATVELSKFQH